jgi:hypothetical protein
MIYPDPHIFFQNAAFCASKARADPKLFENAGSGSVPDRSATLAFSQWDLLKIFRCSICWAADSKLSVDSYKFDYCAGNFNKRDPLPQLWDHHLQRWGLLWPQYRRGSGGNHFYFFTFFFTSMLLDVIPGISVQDPNWLNLGLSGLVQKVCRWVNTSRHDKFTEKNKYILLITSVTCNVPTYLEKIWKFCCNPFKFFFSWPRFKVGSWMRWTRISRDADRKLFLTDPDPALQSVSDPDWIRIRIEFESGFGSSPKFLNKIKSCNLRDLV